MPQTGVTLKSSRGHYVSIALKTNCRFPARGHTFLNAFKVSQLGGSCQVKGFLLTCMFLCDPNIPCYAVLMVETRSPATMCMWQRNAEKCVSSVASQGLVSSLLVWLVFVCDSVSDLMSGMQTYRFIWQWYAKAGYMRFLLPHKL